MKKILYVRPEIVVLSETIPAEAANCDDVGSSATNDCNSSGVNASLQCNVNGSSADVSCYGLGSSAG